jgi:flagellin-like protein
MINKKGVDAVVATVLLILITLAAAAMVSQFLIPFVKNSLQSSSECVPYRDYFKFQELFSYKGQDYYYNCEIGNNYGAIVKAEGKDGSRIGGFAIVLSNNTSSKKISVLSGAISSEVKMLALNDSIIIPSPGEIRTYVLSVGNQNMNKMEIYPVLKNGHVCDKTDEIVVTNCADGAVLS